MKRVLLLALLVSMQVHAAGPLARDQDETRAASRIEVTSTDFKAGARIPLKQSGYGASRSPQLAWTQAPNAKSYAVILEDPDAAMDRPYVHWVAWNVPASTTQLPASLPTSASLTDPQGMAQGVNSRNTSGYFGPRPPKGDPIHHYHFQVFALDATLDLPAGSKRDDLLRAMKGHVIAKGELVGVYQQPDD